VHRLGVLIGARELAIRLAKAVAATREEEHGDGGEKPEGGHGFNFEV
jgi:hypothetical protein